MNANAKKLFNLLKEHKTSKKERLVENESKNTHYIENEELAGYMDAYDSMQKKPNPPTQSQPLNESKQTSVNGKIVLTKEQIKVLPEWYEKNELLLLEANEIQESIIERKLELVRNIQDWAVGEKNE